MSKKVKQAKALMLPSYALTPAGSSGVNEKYISLFLTQG